MLSFPTIVYRSPGQHAGPNGKTYDYLGVNDEAAYSDALASGWYPHILDACNPAKPVSAEPAASEPVVDEVPADDAPVTRAELEAKANELGVKFDGRTSDALLFSRINAALGV